MKALHQLPLPLAGEGWGEGGMVFLFSIALSPSPSPTSGRGELIAKSAQDTSFSRRVSGLSVRNSNPPALAGGCLVFKKRKRDHPALIVGIERHRRFEGAHGGALHRTRPGGSRSRMGERRNAVAQEFHRVAEGHSVFLMTQSMGPPPMAQPKQCHRFLAGVTTRLAVSSSWKGHWPS